MPTLDDLRGPGVNSILDYQFEINWETRAQPLTPVGAGARGRSAIALGLRLLKYSDDELAQLKGVVGEETMVVLGATELLPWVDGIVYLGRNDSSSSLLLPTTYVPNVHVSLLENALLARHKGHAPLVVFLNPTAVVSVAKALPVQRNALQQWLAPGKTR
jgi:hypothetical protein